MSEAPYAEPIPAATLVLFRARDGRSELLMVERNAAMAFAAGALVFPGGRIDPGDHALAATFGGDPEDIAARIAAIRETIEEVGLPIGLAGAISIADLDRLRAALHGGATIGTALDAIGAMLDPGALVPFARWCPRHRHARIFDTRFYLAAAPDDLPTARVDATENVRLIWASARDVLDLADRGEARIIFPTRRNLERLAQFDSFAHAALDAAHFPPSIITPWHETRNGEEHLCIPADLGYPVTSEPIGTALRG